MLLNNLSIAFLVPLALAATPLGGGRWKKVELYLNPQHCAGGQIKGDSFHLPPKANGQKVGSGCGNGHLRAECSSEDYYNSGVHQFTGKFSINSFKGDRISLKQTLENKGVWFMLTADKSGNLYGVGGRGMIAQELPKLVQRSLSTPFMMPILVYTRSTSMGKRNTPLLHHKTYGEISMESTLLQAAQGLLPLPGMMSSSTLVSIGLLVLEICEDELETGVWGFSSGCNPVFPVPS
ncbi:hypothetical protein FOYG_00775 [Fusarium oxysporum NRRL 32931]|uniref:Uncharacterized protein n=1 Tax=Fusarium oxysporum NRRL 32931 TaxID=660029 RepID=W9J8P5_FUSOX|nr:hypothetical protein FOYG_00775 [Fusarium oxysporum NRRL 32931]